jgi:hypothetical protein
MDIAPGDTLSIEGEQLTAWAVLAGGAHVRMDFIGGCRAKLLEALRCAWE